MKTITGIALLALLALPVAAIAQSDSGNQSTNDSTQYSGPMGNNMMGNNMMGRRGGGSMMGDNGHMGYGRMGPNGRMGYGRMMGPNSPMGYGMMGGMMMGNWMPMMGWGGNGAAMCAAMDGLWNAQLSGLKSPLNITQRQEPLWQAYAAATRANARSMIDRCNAMVNGTPNMTQRFKLQEQFMAAQLKSMRAVDKAMEPLYASFSAAQKQAVNGMYWCPMGMVWGRGMYRGNNQ